LTIHYFFFLVVIPSKCLMTYFCIVAVCHFTQHALGIVVIPIYDCEIAGGIRACYCRIACSLLEISYLYNLQNLLTLFNAS